MKRVFLTTLFFSLSLVFFCHQNYPMPGGSQKQLFDRNDTNIEAAFNVLKSSILQSADSNDTIDVIPVAVYSQIVNGINYKIVAAIKDRSKKSVSLVNSVLYLSFYSTTPSITTLKTLPKNDTTELFDQTELSGLSNEMKTYLGQKQMNLTNIVSIYAYPNLINDDDSYYLINTNINSGKIQSNQFFIVNEEIDEDGNKTYTNLQLNFDS